MPGNTGKLACKRMIAKINIWKAPKYRLLNIDKPSWGPFEKYVEVTFPRPKEREMLINWLAWCLQNQGDKPGWAPSLYSSTKESGKSTFAKIAGYCLGLKTQQQKIISINWFLGSMRQSWKRNWSSLKSFTCPLSQTKRMQSKPS